MLSINMKFIHGILVVDLDGELTSKTRERINKNLIDIIKDNGIKYVVLNLDNILNIDKYGIEAIIDSYNEIKENNGKLVLCGISRLLENTNKIKLNEYVYEINDVEDAYKVMEEQ